VSRKSFKRLREELLERAGPHGITLLEIRPARARGYLAAVRPLSPRGLTIEQEAQLTGLFGDPKDAASPLRGEPPLPLEQEQRRLAESALVHEELEANSWIPDQDSVRSLALKLDEVATSSLYVNDDQRREQDQNELSRAVDAWVDPARRERYAGRLFELAEAFRAGKRAEAAERAAAAARALSRGEAANAIPFCRQLFEKLLKRPPKDKEAPGTPSAPQGLVVPP
jgi:hypothetical protein